MNVSMIGGYYTIDIRRQILRNFPDIPHSGECYVVVARLKEKTSGMTDEQKIAFLDRCMKKCVKMYRYGKAKKNSDIMHRSAAVANAILDLIIQVQRNLNEVKIFN